MRVNFRASAPLKCQKYVKCHLCYKNKIEKMTKRLTVSISGPALSLLLYENSKTRFGQEGFLLGEIVERRKTTITDTEQKQEHVETKIQINSAIPCHCISYFYNGMGIIDTKKLDDFLQHFSTKVVAWYRYRPNVPDLRLSIRDKIVHKQLAEYFNIPLTKFTCCLLISQCKQETQSTHSFIQNFVRINDFNNIDNLPLHIANLSDPRNTYIPAEPVTETFNQIVKDLKIDIDKGQSVGIILKIQNAIQKHLETVVDNLSEAERRIFDLENEIKLLLKEKEQFRNGEKKPDNTNAKKETRETRVKGGRKGNIRNENNEDEPYHHLRRGSKF